MTDPAFTYRSKEHGPSATDVLGAMKRVIAVLKKRFPNLTTDETATLAADVIEAAIATEPK